MKVPNLIRLFLLSLFILVSLVPTTAASAHRPVLGEENSLTVIPDLETSFAYYRNLPAGDVDVYMFEGKAGQQFHAGIQIPAISGLDDFSVTVALLGPGLPKADHDQLPPEHPEDLGALIVPTTRSEDFFESFTQTRYWGRQSLDTVLPADGTYYILIWMPEDRPGKYVMDTGYAEEFHFGDLLLFPVWWVQVHLFFGHGPQILVGTAMFLTLVIVLVRRRKAK